MTPWMISALALSLSLSMGELGATVMIYPPGWTTLPVTIFSLTDRGNIADGSALTIVLAGVTLLLNIPISAIVEHLAGVAGIAQLPAAGGVILVIISLLLTTIAGLIPSRIASRKDPVEALRTE